MITLSPGRQAAGTPSQRIKTRIAGVAAPRDSAEDPRPSPLYVYASASMRARAYLLDFVVMALLLLAGLTLAETVGVPAHGGAAADLAWPGRARRLRTAARPFSGWHARTSMDEPPRYRWCWAALTILEGGGANDDQVGDDCIRGSHYRSGSGADKRCGICRSGQPSSLSGRRDRGGNAGPDKVRPTLRCRGAHVRPDAGYDGAGRSSASTARPILTTISGTASTSARAVWKLTMQARST